MDAIRYTAFVRGINVGGHDIIKMHDLRLAFEKAGCKAVRTYIASGNVLFSSPSGDTGEITRAVQAQLQRRFASEAAVLLRTRDELEALVKKDPFAARGTPAEAKRYVSFLFAPPKKKPALPLLSPAGDYEVFALKGRELYWVSHCVDGAYGGPDVEKLLGVAVTTRNWNTLCKMAALPLA